MFRKGCCISVRRSLTVVELMGKFNHAMLVDHQSAAKLRQFAYQLYNAYALLVLFIKGSSYTDFLCRIYVGNGVFNVFIGKDLLNILSVNSGYARIPFSTAVHSIFQPHMEGTSVVVAQFRVPRIVLAVLCGMGLALAGCVMQTVTGNPLADPGILGINAGAGFAVMLFLTFFPALHIRTMAYQPIFAIAGGLCTSVSFCKEERKTPPNIFSVGRHRSCVPIFFFYADHGREHGQQQLSARGKMACRKYLGNELASGSCPVALYAHTGSFSSYKVEHTGYSHFRREYGHFSGDSRREGVETAPDCIGGSYLCLRCR